MLRIGQITRGYSARFPPSAKSATHKNTNLRRQVCLEGSDLHQDRPHDSQKTPYCLVAVYVLAAAVMPDEPPPGHAMEPNPILS